MRTSFRPVCLAPFLFLLPAFVASLQFVDAASGDNVNYLAAYSAIEPGLSRISDSYSHYLIAVGVSSFEPLLPVLFWLGRSLGASYFQVIFFLNSILAFSLSILICKVFKRPSAILAISCVAGTSYYVFLCFAELHRLSLSLSVFFLGLIIGSSSRLASFAVLGHLQSLVLFPARDVLDPFSFQLRRFLGFFLVVCVSAFIAFPYLAPKLDFYSSTSTRDSASVIALASSLSAFLYVFCAGRLLSFLKAIAPALAASLVIGGGRLNFFIVSIFVVVVSAKIERGNSSLWFKCSSAAVFALFAADSLRKFTEYASSRS